MQGRHEVFVALGSVARFVAAVAPILPVEPIFWTRRRTEGQLDRDQADHDLTVGPPRRACGEAAFICRLRGIATVERLLSPEKKVDHKDVHSTCLAARCEMLNLCRVKVVKRIK